MTGPHDFNQHDATPHGSAPHDPAASRDFHRERLSSMLDGALSADETRFLLRRMQHDDELADAWQRWQFYGDALRGEAGRALPADFAQRVGRAIADDEARAIAELAAAEAPAGGRRGPLLRWGGGAALAASVALAAVLVGRGPSVPEGEPLPTPSVATANGAPQVPPPVPTPAPPSGQDGSGEAFVLAAAAVAAASATTAESRNGRPRIMAADRAESHSQTPSQTLRMETAVAAAATASPARPLRPRTESSRPPATVLADAGASRGIAADAEIVAKPWPRSLVPGAGHAGGVMAGYGDTPALPSILRPDADRAGAQDALPRFQAPPPAQAAEASAGSP
jgi:negative regulator of sigma E activity